MNKAAVKFLTNLIPVKKYRKMIRDFLLLDLDEYVLRNIDALKKSELKPLSKPYKAPKNTYKKIITTCGFGHSGSGTMIDFLSEFDNITVIGGHDINGGSPMSTDKNIPKVEVDFVRRYGGVIDLENAFTSKTYHSRVRLLNFIHFSENNYKSYGFDFIYNDEYMRLTREFVDKLISSKILMECPMAGDNCFTHLISQNGDYSNLEAPLIYQNNHNRYFYNLKNLTVKEYRKLAKEYIVSVLKTLESKEILVLDSFLGDGSHDYEKFNDYLDNYKTIIVWRDPRDVYVTGVLLNESWIPKNKEDFVNWYNAEIIKHCIEIKSPNVITLRFEDIVLKYDETITRLLDFLEIDKSHHVAPKTQFRPEYSMKNIGLYKNFEDKETIKYIEDNLKEYCYCGE